MKSQRRPSPAVPEPSIKPYPAMAIRSPFCSACQPVHQASQRTSIAASIRVSSTRQPRPEHREATLRGFRRTLNGDHPGVLPGPLDIRGLRNLATSIFSDALQWSPLHLGLRSLCSSRISCRSGPQTVACACQSIALSHTRNTDMACA